MSANSEERHEAGGGATGPAPPPALSASPPPTGTPASCRKKKADVDEGFVKDIVNHIDEFVHASYDEHKSCLQKSMKKLFGSTKSVANSTSAAPPRPAPVVSVLPLRVEENS